MRNASTYYLSNTLLFYSQIKYAYLKRTVCSVLENIKNLTSKANRAKAPDVLRSVKISLPLNYLFNAIHV